MRSDEQPAQTLTDAKLSRIESHWSRYREFPDRDNAERVAEDVPDLLAEVDRLRAELDKYRQWLDALESAAGYGNLADVVSDLAERELPGDHAARLRAKRVASMVATVTEETAWRHQYLSDIESERDRLKAQNAAARKVLFDDAFEGHAQRYRALARALGNSDE